MRKWQALRTPNSSVKGTVHTKNTKPNLKGQSTGKRIENEKLILSFKVWSGEKVAKLSEKKKLMVKRKHTKKYQTELNGSEH